MRNQMNRLYYKIYNNIKNNKNQYQIIILIQLYHFNNKQKKIIYKKENMIQYYNPHLNVWFVIKILSITLLII